MATRIFPTSRSITIQELRWTLGGKAVFRFQYAPDTFHGDLLDDEGNAEDNPHQYELEEEIEVTLCGRTFVGKIYVIPESLGEERVTYTAYDFIHEIERTHHEYVYEAYNVPEGDVIDQATQNRNIRQILEQEFAGVSDIDFDWDELQQIGDKYPYEFVPPNYSPKGKTQLQVIRDLLSFNPALSFYGHNDGTNKTIVIVNAAEFSKTTYEVDFRYETDNATPNITTDSSNKYAAVTVKTWGEVHEKTEAPVRAWKDVVESGDAGYTSEHVGLDKRPGLIDQDDEGIEFDPKLQPERYKKYKLNDRIYKTLLRVIGERDTTDDDPSDIELNDNGKVNVVGVIGKPMIIKGPSYEFDRAAFHVAAQSTEYDEDTDRYSDEGPHYLNTDELFTIKKIIRPDPESGGGDDALETIYPLVDYGEPAKYRNVKTPSDEYSLFWTNQAMVVRHVVKPNKGRRNYDLELFREIGNAIGGSEDPENTDDLLHITYPAITADIEYTKNSKDGKGTGTKEIFVNYVKYYGANDDGDETLIWDDTEDAETLAEYYRDFYCRAKVSGAFNYHHTTYSAKLPFWLGWNVGIADGAIKSIDLAQAATHHNVAVTMESHHFGTTESNWDENINQPPVFGSDKKFGYGAGATGSGNNGEDETVPEQEKEGVVAAHEGTTRTKAQRPVVINKDTEATAYSNGIVQVKEPDATNLANVFVTTRKGLGDEDQVLSAKSGVVDYPVVPFLAEIDAEVEPGDMVGTSDESKLFVKNQYGFEVLAYVGENHAGNHIAWVVRPNGVILFEATEDADEEKVPGRRIKQDSTLVGDEIYFWEQQEP